MNLSVVSQEYSKFSRSFYAPVHRSRMAQRKWKNGDKPAYYWKLLQVASRDLGDVAQIKDDN
jgi:hypothetical protein